MIYDVFEEIKLIQILQVLRIQQSVVVGLANLLSAGQRSGRNRVESLDLSEVAQIG